MPVETPKIIIGSIRWQNHPPPPRFFPSPRRAHPPGTTAHPLPLLQTTSFFFPGLFLAGTYFLPCKTVAPNNNIQNGRRTPAAAAMAMAGGVRGRGAGPAGVAGRWAAPRTGARGAAAAARAGMGGLDPKKMQELMANPEVMKQVQEMQQMMSNPEVQKEMQQAQAFMQSDKMQEKMKELQNDPEVSRSPSPPAAVHHQRRGRAGRAGG